MCKNATDLRSDLTNLKTGNADIVVKSWRTDELFPFNEMLDVRYVLMSLRV